jgi:uncharacterized protein YgiM (DUF1202 family)
MKSRINSIAFVVIACLVTISFGQATTPGTASPGGQESMQAQPFPYLAEVTGDDVLIRTGPGTGFYSCGKFKEGDKIQIVGTQFTWSKIVPPTSCYSWISMQYVNIDSEDPSYGTVSGDNVRVYAGADNLRPSYSTSLQTKLSKGDKVKLLGEQLDDYYKIAPPQGAYLWVSTNYTNKITPAVEGPMPRIAMAPGVDTMQGTDISTGTGTESETGMMDTVSDTNDIAVVKQETQLDKYYEVQKQIETERAKPMDQQDYTSIKEALNEIINDENADKAARYAQAVIEQVKGYELAIEVGKTVKLQNEQLKKTKEQIDKARTERLTEIEDLGKYAVIGKLENFMTYGPGHYRIVDETDKTICTALPSIKAAEKDFSSLVGKKVGLIGTIEPYQQTAGALVRFDKIVSME